MHVAIRIDENINAHNKISASYFTGNMPYISTQSLGSLYDGGNTQGNKYLRLGYDFFISPTMLNHFNAGYTRRHRVEGSGNGGFGGNWATKFGLKGSTEVGPGVKANFDLQSNGITSNGEVNSPFFGRQAQDAELALVLVVVHLVGRLARVLEREHHQRQRHDHAQRNRDRPAGRGDHSGSAKRQSGHRRPARNILRR